MIKFYFIEWRQVESFIVLLQHIVLCPSCFGCCFPEYCKEEGARPVQLHGDPPVESSCRPKTRGTLSLDLSRKSNRVAAKELEQLSENVSMYTYIFIICVRACVFLRVIISFQILITICMHCIVCECGDLCACDPNKPRLQLSELLWVSL